MMTGTDFKRSIGRALTKSGLARTGDGIYSYTGDGVRLLVDAKPGFGRQWFVNIGFWLLDVGGGGEMLDRVERSHLYYRLDRLFPTLADTILAAGRLDDVHQLSAHPELMAKLENVILPRLKELAGTVALRRAFQGGELNGGLVTRVAREFLRGTGT